MGTKQLSVGVATAAFRNDVSASYVSCNSLLWSLTSTSYRISPADSSSDQNNVSDALFGGSSTAALRSFDRFGPDPSCTTRAYLP